jgi:ATP-dependent helicase/nuclease subunit B
VRGFEAFLAFDAERRTAAERILIEQGGRLEIALADGSTFALTARADRIELLHAGGAALIDYKSGSPPGVGEIQVGFAPQLTLEAAMLSRGAFPGLVGVETVAALYFKLGGAKGGETRELKFKDVSFQEIVERHFAGLKVLLDQFADPKTPYLARLYPKFAKRAGPYDHLARVKEWSATGGLSDDAQGEEG